MWVGTLFSENCHPLLVNLKNILHAVGSSLVQILKVKILWKFFGRFDDSRPARACIEVSKSLKGVDMLIEAIDQISEVS